MIASLAVALSALSFLVLLVLIWLAWRQNLVLAELLRTSAELMQMQMQSQRDWPEQMRALDQALREEVARSASHTRQELHAVLAHFQQTMLTQQGDAIRSQNEQLDSFRVQLGAMQQALGDTLRQTTTSLTQQSSSMREAQSASLSRFADAQEQAFQRLTEALNQQLRTVAEHNQRQLSEVKHTVETRLQALQSDNEKKLEQMRQTVDEKLHATLEQRLGESFQQVAQRLEQVHRGLGEMQGLAQGVGDLKRVLSNVKSRGIFGETQLAGLLEQVFTTEQYAVNIVTVPGSSERVEFAIQLPGRGADQQPMWLPIDAKFPREDYERLLEAQDQADRPASEAAGKALEQRVREEAKTIAHKYVAPPHTTDFAILFLPVEGLYAELLRRPGLTEYLQRQYRVILAGPTTLLAILNSLQMGFRTLALEKRSSEVWKVLGAVKTEFTKFGDILSKTKKKLDEASNTIELAERRTRVMNRELRAVEALPVDQIDDILVEE